MYQKIVIALDESHEAKRALTRAIELAKHLGSELHIVTVSEPLPAYAGFMDSEIPGGREMLLKERNAFYGDLQKEGIQQATAAGIEVEGVVAEGGEVQAIVDHILAWGADLLVIGRRHHSTMSRLWGGTVHNIAEKVRCSILAVY
jgi:nucleotide-binding universal stress UspA family protein